MLSIDQMFEEARRRPLIAAHRGVSSANIPCNTLAAFEIALRQQADIVEIDVAQSRDGALYVFHPGMERAHLRSDRLIRDMTRDEVDALVFVNQDDMPTTHHVNTLDETLEFLKGAALSTWTNSGRARRTSPAAFARMACRIR